VRRTVLRWIFRALAVAISLGMLELIAWVALPIVERATGTPLATTSQRLADQVAGLERILDSQGTALLELDPELGWRYAPGRASGQYTSNHWGARGPRDPAARPPEGVLRVAAFGDSFVHGNEVADDEAWSHVLEDLDPGIEVLNFGVGGYGTDQALLRYERHAPDLNARVIVLGFTSVDYSRNLERYRPFLAPDDLPLAKPRFRLDGEGGLVEVPTPFGTPHEVRALLVEPRRLVEVSGPGDYFYEPLVWRNPLFDRSHLVRVVTGIGLRFWNARLRPDRLWVGGQMNTESEGFGVLEAIVRRFHAEVTARGDRFLFLVYPDHADLVAGELPYQPLIDALADLPVEDLSGTLRQEFGADLAAPFAKGGHYNALGNAAVARRLHAILARGAPLHAESRSP